MSQTILVTGVSSGLGRAFAAQALAAGHIVIGTVRTTEDAEAFEQLATGSAHARILDITHTDEIAPLVSDIEGNIGPVDVLINNAGYGVEGTFEETDLPTFQRQFDVNVFGSIAVTQALLPHLRARRRGHIVFVTSMGGLRTFPGLAAYHASKFALEGIAGALADEVGPLGIHVTALEPGAFRTDWAGRSMRRVASQISDYSSILGPVRERRRQASGNQLGNPVLAAQALLAILDTPQPPRHLILGSDALRLVADARATFDAETEAWAELSRSTDDPQD